MSRSWRCWRRGVAKLRDREGADERPGLSCFFRGPIAAVVLVSEVQRRRGGPIVGLPHRQLRNNTY
jgi:hypothetical protein